MPRNAARGQPGHWLGLALLVLACVVSLGADDLVPARPAGMTPVASVAMALELALLARGDWSEIPGSLDEARDVLQRPDLSPLQVRDEALAAAARWSARSEPARRLHATWSAVQKADRRMEIIDASGAVGQLARLALVAEFCEALEGSTHLPPAQAAGLLARSTATHDAVHALELVGPMLEEIQPTTLLGSHRLASWRALLALARVPGPLGDLDLPRAQGLPLERPAAPLVRIGVDRVVLSARGLVSWSEGDLVVDSGPPPDVLDSWSPSAWQRWQAIARRRSELSLAGITALQPPDAHRDVSALVPNLLVSPTLRVERLVEVLGWLHAEGVPRACLLVRRAEHEQPRQLCAEFRPGVPAGGQSWRLGRGGLSATGLPVAGSAPWAVADSDALVEDLVLALEEARHAGRGLGLAAEE